MKTLPDWRSYTVQEFFQSCNWRGTSAAKITESPAQLTHDWPCQTVEAFFQVHNWSGQTRTPQILKGGASPRANTLDCTVSEYFAAIPWDGPPLIGNLPLIKLPTAPPRSDHDLKLSDLSNLF